jgi:hypothetical protein
MTNKLAEFNYSDLDVNTADYLKQKEINMREIVGKAYTDLGRELKEAQEKLSNHRNGIFEEWYTSLGFKKQTVYNYINRYNLIVQSLDNKELIEELPLNLVYEVAKPSADKKLKQKVLDGEIDNLKDYKELSKKTLSEDPDVIVAEIKLYKKHLDQYKEWFAGVFDRSKWEKHEKSYDDVIKSLGAEQFEFVKEGRIPSDEEFLEYVIYSFEQDLKEHAEYRNRFK